jgi:hypothetical protein
VKPTDADRDPAFDRLIARSLEGEADVSGRACPDADLLAAWFDRSLSASEAERIEAHASACAVCQQILADLARSEPPVVRAAPVPQPGRPWHWHWRWLVPAVTVVVVVVVVGNRTLRAPQAPVTVVAREDAAVRGDQAPAMGADAVQTPAPQTATMPVGPAVAKDSAAPPAGVGQRNEQKRATARADTNAPTGGSVGGILPPDAERRAAPAAAPAMPPPLQQQAPPKSDEAVGYAAARMAAAKPADARLRAEESVVTAVPPGATPAPAVGGAAMNSVSLKAESRAGLVPAVALSPRGQFAWRVGEGGRIDRSTDGGISWQAQASGITANLKGASAASDTACWAVGAAGAVLRTTDGTTWQRLESPTGADLVSVRALSRDAAIVKASDGSEYSTSDAGKTWRKTGG